MQHERSGGALKRQAIFHHPVGIFPSAARWYLAAIATLALLAVTLQLSIQAAAQQQAGELIQAWAKRAHMQIGDVRYHLLRNGLILQQILIKRGNDRVSIEQMLLRANPKLLTGNAPRIGMIDISGLRAEISHASNPEAWRQSQALRQIWQAATELSLRDGQLTLHLDGRDAPALIFSELELHQEQHAALRSMQGSARLPQGDVSWQWYQNLATPSPHRPFLENPHIHNWLSRGSLQWHGVDVERLLAALALKPLNGSLDGDISWDVTRTGNSDKPSLQLQAQAELQTAGEMHAAPAHMLKLTATQSDDQWLLDIDAAAWPLDPWSAQLPQIGTRRLIAAQWNGRARWQGRSGAWRINSAQGELQDLIYAAPATGAEDARHHQAWYWSRVSYRDAAINTQRRRLRFKQIDMRDSLLVLQSERADTGAANAPQQLAWQINADDIRVQNMMLALVLPNGAVKLEALDGQASCPDGKALRFKLRTHSDERAAPPGTDPQTASLLRWRLRGEAQKDQFGRLSSAKMRLRGEHVPLSRLRPLLPLQGDAERAITLTGQASLDLAISADRGAWRMQGKAQLRDITLGYGGNRWLAEQMSLRFGPVGMGLESQPIDSIDSSGWHYIAALSPLPLHAAQKRPDSEPDRIPWWISSLRNRHIEIRRLRLDDGRISIGEATSLWADRVHIQADHIQAGQWADLQVDARVGGSDFRLNGQWQALSNAQRFRGDAGLELATPFFVRNWLQASGMPRLVRGRLSAALQVRDGEVPDSYLANVSVELLRGEVERGLFTADPLLTRTGFKTSELLQRLEREPGRIALTYELQGEWGEQPLTLERLGLAMQQQMHELAGAGSWRADAGQSAAGPDVIARVRLHGRERLSQNERIRLYKVVRNMRAHPDLMIDLRPQWIGAELTPEEIRRIRRTQQFIENYLTHRKIGKARIFPVWPTAADRVDEIGSIQVEAITALRRKQPE